MLPCIARICIFACFYSIILSSHIVYVYAIMNPRKSLRRLVPLRTAQFKRYERLKIQATVVVSLHITPAPLYRLSYSTLIHITVYILYSYLLPHIPSIVYVQCVLSLQMVGLARLNATWDCELSAFGQPQIIALASYYGISIFIQTTILLKYAYLENSFLFPIQFNKYITRGVYSTISL